MLHFSRAGIGKWVSFSKCWSGGMVYTYDSKSYAVRLMGSSPISSTLYTNPVHREGLRVGVRIKESHRVGTRWLRRYSFLFLLCHLRVIRSSGLKSTK